MTDVVNGPSHDEAPRAYQMQPWEQEWANEYDDARKVMRLRGLDVLHRIKENLPLSERESAVAQKIHDGLETSKQQYMEQFGDPVYGDDDDTAKLLVEQIGTQLLSPTDELAVLSDERPPEVSG